MITAAKTENKNDLLRELSICHTFIRAPLILWLNKRVVAPRGNHPRRYDRGMDIRPILLPWLSRESDHHAHQSKIQSSRNLKINVI